MNRLPVSIPRLAIVGFIALFAAGCAGLSGVGAPLTGLIFTAALLVGGVVACTPVDQDPSDTWTVEGEADGSDVRDTVIDTEIKDTDREIDEAEGSWETCCEDGVISTCYCPPKTACNYGLFSRCGGNTCSYGGCPPEAGDTGDAVDVPDTGDVPDVSDAGDAIDAAEGSWDPCCKNGEISTCYCPPGAACNYGRFKSCGGNTCTYAFGDAGCSTDTGVDTAD